jgi:hypothetical protein
MEQPPLRNDKIELFAPSDVTHHNVEDSAGRPRKRWNDFLSLHKQAASLITGKKKNKKKKCSWMSF